MPDCEQCNGTGIHSVPWANEVQRCDFCERYDTDFDAIQALLMDTARVDWLESKADTIGISRETIDEAIRQEDKRHA